MSSLLRIMSLSLTTLLLLSLSAFAGVSIYRQVVSIENSSTGREVPDDDVTSEPMFQQMPNLLADTDCGFIDSDNRIFAGNRTELFEFPWMALLAYTNTEALPTPFLCAGTLITNRHVLTAAHCLNGISGMQLKFVRLGEHDLRTSIDCDVSQLGDKECAPPHMDFGIDQLIPHPKFGNRQNDIAIIVLAQAADTSQNNIKRICLPFSKLTQSMSFDSLLATGWGLTENGTASDVLLKTQMPLVSLKQCQRIYRNEMLTKTQFCAGGDLRMGRNGNTCMGDSGGPLQAVVSTSITDADDVQVSELRYYQFGVISMGPTVCWARGQPTIHTRVIDFLPWISEVVLMTSKSKMRAVLGRGNRL